MARARSKRGKEPEPEIAIVGELVDEAESDVIKAILDVPPGEGVTVYIDSAGGGVYAALAIAALIRLRRLKATAIVIGECSSSALLIFASCPQRFVTPHSVFLFHRVRWQGEKEVRSEEATNWASHFQWLETEVDRYQAELFGVPPERFTDWIEKGRFVLGSEMVALGVAQMLEV